jgi:RNA polymerase sigma-70 factor (ECF subfamily)
MDPKLHLDGGTIAAPAKAVSVEDAVRSEFARMTAENERPLFSYIFSRLHDYHLTCDILQETLHAAWEKRDTRKLHLPPLPWLKKIAYHKIGDHFDAEGAIKRGGGKNDVTVVVLGPNCQPRTGALSDSCVAAELESWQEAAKNERDEALRAAIESLPTRDREIIGQFYTDRVPIADIAAFFDITVAATTAILHRTRGTLGKKLKAMGFSDASSEVNRHLKGDIM